MKLLYVDCCISQRGEGSRTATLARSFLEGWRTAHPQGQVETVFLPALALPALDLDSINQRDALFDRRAFDHPVFDLARQFAGADAIVVAAPFWDLSFPALLRIYIEHISANGVSYYYDDQGPHGKCAATQLVYLTSGGDFEQPESQGVAHWRQLCSMYGIGGFSYVFASGLDAVPERATEFLQEACAKAAALGRDV